MVQMRLGLFQLLVLTARSGVGEADVDSSETTVEDGTDSTVVVGGRPFGSSKLPQSESGSCRLLVDI